MRTTLIGVALLAALAGGAHGRGFGGARGGYRAAGVGPAGGFHSAGGYRAAGVGPYGGARAGGASGHTYVGPRGTTVQAGRAGGVGVGPFGGVHAGGAAGARVTTPGGRTFTEGARGGVAVGPGGRVAAGGSRGAAVSGPGGAAAVGARGGFAAGPRGVVAAGARAGAAVGPFGGVVAGGGRGGVAVGRGGVAWAGHSTRYVSPASFHASAAVVRTGGGWGYTAFTPSWYRAHPVVWAPARWATPTFWVAPAWPALVTWVNVAGPPVAYDYGSTVVIHDETVYVNGTKAATAPEYAEQATKITDAGRKADPPAEDEWRPLGVFGLVQGDEKVAQNLFQLAVNKAGVVRGNYYDALADNSLKVFGSVDRKTQRVAWSIGEKKDIVYEAGLSNLTKDETAVLVHYGKDRTRQMMLVRIEQPKDATKTEGGR